MSLEERKKRFALFTQSFPCEVKEGLIAIHSLNPHLLERLRFSANLYIAKSLQESNLVNTQWLADSKPLLSLIESNLAKIKNFTPNGMVVPKRDHLLEYNFFASAFMDVVNSLNIGHLIDYWINPPNIRFKEGSLNPKKLERNFASEHTHSESWIPLNGSQCISIFIPLAGDLENNFVDFFLPPQNFEETWLAPQPSYASASEISHRFRPANIKYELGKLYLADCSTLHATTRKTSSGPRLSIDLNFIPKLDGIHHSSTDLSHENLLRIGKETLFAFHDSMDEFSETNNGKHHPAERRTLIEPFA